MIDKTVGRFIVVGDQILATDGLLGVCKSNNLLSESSIEFKYQNGFGDDNHVVEFDSAEQMEKEFQKVLRQLVK